MVEKEEFNVNMDINVRARGEQENITIYIVMVCMYDLITRSIYATLKSQMNILSGADVR